jgi:hypothetical protein
MALLTPPPPAPQRGVKATFVARFDAFITWIVTFVGELTALVANLNSFAAGGAYAIPYKVSGDSGDIGKGGYFTIQSNNTSLFFDNIDTAGRNVASTLSNLFSGSSSVKAALKLVEVTDPNRYVVWNIFSFTTAQGSINVTAQIVSDTNGGRPFTTALALFSRTGDAGGSGMAQTMIVRDEKANGTLAQVLSAATWNRRHLTRVTANSIPGAQLNANLIILLAGNYVLEASSPAANCSGNQARLYNVTDNVLLDLGTSDCNYLGNYATTKPVISRSVLQTSFSITSTKSFAIDHWVEETGSGGRNANAGVAEVYTTVKITKVS